jgi:hypothetical protein
LKKASQKATKARRRRRLAPWHIETIEKWDYSDTVFTVHQGVKMCLWWIQDTYTSSHPCYWLADGPYIYISIYYFIL